MCVAELRIYIISEIRTTLCFIPLSPSCQCRCLWSLHFSLLLPLPARREGMVNGWYKDVQQGRTGGRLSARTQLEAQWDIWLDRHRLSDTHTCRKEGGKRWPLGKTLERWKNSEDLTSCFWKTLEHPAERAQHQQTPSSSVHTVNSAFLKTFSML